MCAGADCQTPGCPGWSSAPGIQEPAPVDRSVPSLICPWAHRPALTQGVREEECRAILSQFFQQLRKKK